MSGLDLDSLIAIDVHVEQDRHGHFSMDDELLAAASRYFKGEHYHPTVPEIAADYRERSMAAVVFTVDSELTTGHPALSNEEIAAAAAEHPDVLIPFGSVDPHRGVAGVRAARRLVTEHGVRGFKFHPSIQAFEPNDRQHYPLYAELESLAALPSAQRKRPPAGRHGAARPQPDAHDDGHLQPRHAGPGPRGRRPDERSAAAG
jgi:predicted TIM-barrel fold metal-dependent hydrolase